MLLPWELTSIREHGPKQRFLGGACNDLRVQQHSMDKDIVPPHRWRYKRKVWEGYRYRKFSISVVRAEVHAWTCANAFKSCVCLKSLKREGCWTFRILRWWVCGLCSGKMKRWAPLLPKESVYYDVAFISADLLPLCCQFRNCMQIVCLPGIHQPQNNIISLEWETDFFVNKILN